MREYQLISPSLDGILRHDSIVYEGIRRPEEILRLMDGPAQRGRKKESSGEAGADEGSPDVVYTEQEQQVIEQYFTDLYSIFLKKLSYFFVESEVRPDDEVKLQAMLQEMIKIKKLRIKHA